MSSTLQFLTWLADPARYVAVSQSVLFALVATIVGGAEVPSLNARLGSRRGVVAFLVLAFFVLLAARWPYFFVRKMLQQDEAQAVAQAITALRFPIPWLDFDPQTAGPLNTYVLLLPVAFGGHVSFLTARVTAVLLEFGAIVGLYESAAVCFDAGIARLAILPPLVFWSVSLEPEFVHYSSEHLAIFLAAVMVALICWGWRLGFPLGLSYGIGAIAGALPLAKLQSVPLDAATLGIAVAVLLRSTTLPLRARYVTLGVLACGIVTVPFVIVAAVALAGAFPDFWRSYIETSLAYIIYGMQPVTFLTSTVEFGPFFDWLGAVTLVGGVVVALRFSQLPVRSRGAYIAAVIILAAAIDGIYSPHRATRHYLLFAVIPVAGAAAAGLAAISWSLAPNALAGPRRGMLAAVFAGICLVAQNAVSRGNYGWIAHDVADYVWNGQIDSIGSSIAAHLRRGERLAIWGYRPEYWVFTDTLMGTRDAASFYQWSRYYNPNREYYRQRYAQDFERNRPEGFLDVGSTSFDLDGASRDGYETFPRLAKLVDRDYVLKGTWERSRLFVRRDVAATRPP